MASGKSYEDFVHDEILKPLGITRMRIGATRAQRKSEGEVRYYTRDNHRAECVFGDELGVSVPVQYGGWCLEAMDAHGDWIASASDLVRLASALDEGARPRLPSGRAIREMFAPPAAPVARDDAGRLTPTYYACGWMVRPIGDAGRANTWHTGGFAGTSTLLVRRHDGFTWAVLFNIDQTKASGKPAALIDGRIHQAIDKIRYWPAG